MKSNFEVDIDHERTALILRRIQGSLNVSANTSFVNFNLENPEEAFLDYLSACYNVSFKTDSSSFAGLFIVSIHISGSLDSKNDLLESTYEYHKDSFVQFYEDAKDYYTLRSMRTTYLKVFVPLLIVALFFVLLKWC